MARALFDAVVHGGKVQKIALKTFEQGTKQAKQMESGKKNEKAVTEKVLADVHKRFWDVE